MEKTQIYDKKPFWVASMSFGKDSLATALLALEKGEPIDRAFYIEVMYCFTRNISAELPEHREFIFEKAIPRLKELGLETDVAKSSRDYMQVFFETIKSGPFEGKVRGFPIAGRCGISNQCKRPVFNAYQRAHRGRVVNWYVGIAADEEERLRRLGQNKCSLLAKYGVTEAEALEVCRRHNLVSPIYESNARNGCWFCPSQRMSSWRYVYENHHDLWQRLEELDDLDCKCSDKFTYRLTLRELEERIRSYPPIKNPK